MTWVWPSDSEYYVRPCSVRDSGLFCCLSGTRPERSRKCRSILGMRSGKTAMRKNCKPLPGGLLKCQLIGLIGAGDIQKTQAHMGEEDDLAVVVPTGEPISYHVCDGPADGRPNKFIAGQKRNQLLDKYRKEQYAKNRQRFSGLSY